MLHCCGGKSLDYISPIPPLPLNHFPRRIHGFMRFRQHKRDKWDDAFWGSVRIDALQLSFFTMTSFQSRAWGTVLPNFIHNIHPPAHSKNMWQIYIMNDWCWTFAKDTKSNTSTSSLFAKTQRCKNAKMQNAFQDAPGQDMISACSTCVLLLSPFPTRHRQECNQTKKSKCKIAPINSLT